MMFRASTAYLTRELAMSQQSIPNRTTIFIGPHLRELLASGRVQGDSVSGRIDRLADRYASLIRELVPSRWSVADWHCLTTVIRELRVERATDALLIGLRLRQLSKERHAASEVGSLAYRFESLRLTDQLAVLDVAERAIAAGTSNVESLAAFLTEQQVATA
jgi:hypothetical protein